jgi:hypothetical protein
MAHKKVKIRITNSQKCEKLPMRSEFALQIKFLCSLRNFLGKKFRFRIRFFARIWIPGSQGEYLQIEEK